MISQNRSKQRKKQLAAQSKRTPPSVQCEVLEPRLLLSATNESTAIDVSQTFSDIGYTQTPAATIDWGDGTTSAGGVSITSTTGGSGSTLTAQVDYSLDTAGFFDNQQARDVLQLAIDSILSNFTDDLNAIVPSATNTWTASFQHPATGVQHTVDDLTVPANTLIIYAGARDLDGPTLGKGGPGGFSASGTTEFVDNVKTRGEAGAGLNDPTDIGLWGGAITFDTAATWHFGVTTDGLDSGENDFLSLAIHELTHLLGLGTSGSWNTLVDETNALFLGPAATAEYDGAGNPPLEPAPDLGHWLDGTTDGNVETAMDPTLTVGTRKELTALDLAGLDDIGWDLTTQNRTYLVTGTHTYADNGSFTPSITLTDSNLTDQATLTAIDVANVDPTLISIISDQNSQVPNALSSITLSFSAIAFIDPGYDNAQDTPPTQETFTYSIDWGDGSSVDTGDASITVNGDDQTNTRGEFAASHTYGVGTYTATMTVTDDDGGSAQQTFNVTIALENNSAPTDITLSNNRVDENSANDTVIGQLSVTDADTGDTHTLELTNDAGGRFKLVGSEIQVADGTQLNFENSQDHSITVRATDLSGLSFDKNITINLDNVNEPPTAIFLSTSTVSDGAATDTVIGTLSASDPDAGQTFTYGLSSNAEGRFKIVGNELQVADTTNFSADTYSITVSVSDQGLLNFETSLNVIITDDNQAPTDLELSNLSVNENTSDGTVVGTILVADPDTFDSHQIELLNNSEGRFGIDGTSLIVAESTLLNFEDLTLATIEIGVMDSGGLSYQETFQIAIEDVNETPTDIILNANVIDETAIVGTVVGDLSATDPDTNDSFTYTLTDDAGLFTIAGTEIQTSAALTNVTSATITVEVEDSGQLTFSKEFTINVDGVNDPPTAIQLSANAVDENTNFGVVIGTLSTTDPDVGDVHTYGLVNDAGGLFDVSGTDLIVANGATIDFETAEQHTIEVRSLDSGSLSVNETFTITVNPLNEPPTSIQLDNTSVNEDAANNTVIGGITGTDPDAGDSLSFFLTNDANGRFSLDGTNLIVADTSQIVFADNQSHAITIRATDLNELTFEESFTIDVNELIINQPPTAIVISNNLVAENAANNSPVGSLTATDPDVGDSHTFTLTNSAGGRFGLSGSTVLIADSSLLNFADSQTHQITVEAEDSVGNTFQQNLTIQLVDVPLPDLIGTIDASRFPTNTLAGERGRFTVTVTNQGDELIRGTTDVMTVLSLDDTFGNADDVILKFFNDQRINLRPGRGKRLNANVTLPSNIPAGDYKILAQVDSSNDVGEGNEQNNLAIATPTIAIRDAFVDLAASFGRINLRNNPATPGDRGSAQVTITNNGNVTARGTITVQLWASTDATLGNADDVLLGENTRQRVNTRPGRFTRSNVRFTIPNTVEEGNYNLIAAVDTTEAITLEDASTRADNAVTSATPITIAFGDLTAGITSTRLARNRGTVRTATTNIGNVTSAGTARVDLIAVRESDGTEFTVASSDRVRLNLRPGRSKTVNFRFDALNLTAGVYRLRVVTDVNDAIREHDESNNDFLTTLPTIEVFDNGTSALIV